MRFAYVLAWKREDGKKIPETAAGLKEHKALVAKYAQERGGSIHPAYRAIIDRKYASVAKKLAAGEVARGKSKARADIEKRRAKLAKRLHKWIDHYGAKIPSTPAGIKKHKAMVASYEQDFGPSSVIDRKARARMYKAIIDSIEAEKVRRKGQASRSKVVAAEKKTADAKLRAKNRTAKEKRDAARAQAEAVRERRNRQGRARYYRHRIQLSVRRIANSEQDVHSDEWLELYRGTSSYESIVKANDRAKQLLKIFRKNLAVYETKLAALQL